MLSQDVRIWTFHSEVEVYAFSKGNPGGHFTVTAGFIVLKRAHIQNMKSVKSRLRRRHEGGGGGGGRGEDGTGRQLCTLKPALSCSLLLLAPAKMFLRVFFMIRFVLPRGVFDSGGRLVSWFPYQHIVPVRDHIKVLKICKNFLKFSNTFEIKTYLRNANS